MKLETRRLLLRPLGRDDAPAMARGLNNFDVARHLARVPFPYTVEMADAYIAMRGDANPRSLFCGITFKCATEEVIGFISYEFGSNNAEATFGYWLRECCWHMGIMSEAATAVVTHTFTVANVDTLGSAYHLDNPNSGRILRGLGFVETHREMNFSLAQATQVPAAQLCLTRQSWLDQQKGRAG